MRLTPPSFKLGKSYSVAFSPSGRLLASVSLTKVTVWDVLAGKSMFSVGNTKEKPINPLKNASHIAFSPDESSLAVKNTSGELCIINASDGEVKLIIRENVSDEGCSPVFTPDGKYLVDGSWDGNIYVWDAETGESVYSEEHMDCMIQEIDYSPTANAYAIAIVKKSDHPKLNVEPHIIRVQKWPLGSGEKRELGVHRDNIWTLRWSPDGSKVAIVTGEGYMNDIVLIIDAATGEELSSYQKEVNGFGADLGWSPDGRLLARTGTIILSAPDLRELKLYDLQFSSQVAFSPDGKLLAMASGKDGMVITLEQLELAVGL